MLDRSKSDRLRKAGVFTVAAILMGAIVYGWVWVLTQIINHFMMLFWHLKLSIGEVAMLYLLTISPYSSLRESIKTFKAKGNKENDNDPE